MVSFELYCVVARLLNWFGHTFISIKSDSTKCQWYRWYRDDTQTQLSRINMIYFLSDCPVIRTYSYTFPIRLSCDTDVLVHISYQTVLWYGRTHTHFQSDCPVIQTYSYTFPIRLSCDTHVLIHISCQTVLWYGRTRTQSSFI